MIPFDFFTFFNGIGFNHQLGLYNKPMFHPHFRANSFLARTLEADVRRLTESLERAEDDNRHLRCFAMKKAARFDRSANEDWVFPRSVVFSGKTLRRRKKTYKRLIRVFFGMERVCFWGGISGIFFGHGKGGAMLECRATTPPKTNMTL